ncbi:MAG TPA: hypothetical protein V6D05_03205 [Stenomitos sp.]
MSIDKLGSGTLNRLLSATPSAAPLQAGGGEEPSTTVPLGDVSNVSAQARTEARPNPYDYIAALPPGYQPPPSNRDIAVFQAQGIDEVRGDQASGIQPVPVQPPVVVTPPVQPPAQPPVVVTPPVQPPVQPPVVVTPPVQPPVITPPPADPMPQPPAVTASPLGPLTQPDPAPTPEPPPVTPTQVEPTPEPTPAPEPKPLGRRLTFSAVADPHVTTADGRKFDNSEAGDFMLARSKAGDLAVQVRQEPLAGDSGVWQTQAAIKTHEDVVRFDAATLRLEINGQVVPFEPGQKVPLPSGGYVQMSKDVLDNGTPFNRLRVHTQEGDDLYMLQFERKNGGRYLDLTGSLAASRASGDVMGSAGSFDGDGQADNDLRSRSGAVMQEVADFLKEWRLTAEESLF